MFGVRRRRVEDILRLVESAELGQGGDLVDVHVVMHHEPVQIFKTTQALALDVLRTPYCDTGVGIALLLRLRLGLFVLHVPKTADALADGIRVDKSP